MNPLTRTQELVRRFNEDEAVQARFEEKRVLRKRRHFRGPWPEILLDELDWAEAEAEIRQTRCGSVLHP